MIEVHKRGGFSDRNNIKPEKCLIQINDFDAVTRTRLYNYVVEINNTLYEYVRRSVPKYRCAVCCYIMKSIYSVPVDSQNERTWSKAFDYIKETFEKDTYDSILTVVESLSQYWNDYYKDEVKHILNSNIFKSFNLLFEQEYIGYRFIGKVISQISDNIEIRAIEGALSIPESAVSEHISKANILLSDRKHPDYENSIKESITAVETMCEMITGVKGSEATLSNMLKKLESNGAQIHGALKRAFEVLYGFTNDGNGIRHAGNIGGPSATFEEAKFMMVACSAFINY